MDRGRVVTCAVMALHSCTPAADCRRLRQEVTVTRVSAVTLASFGGRQSRSSTRREGSTWAGGSVDCGRTVTRQAGLVLALST